MLAVEFNEILKKQMRICKETLGVKATEYAKQDRLHNFKKAAHLKGITVRNALSGIMVKHTISIYDMCESDEIYPLAVWNEKITDHINYLILLRAVVEEEIVDEK